MDKGTKFLASRRDRDMRQNMTMGTGYQAARFAFSYAGQGTGLLAQEPEPRQKL
jgi:hypothetical protein